MTTYLNMYAMQANPKIMRATFDAQAGVLTHAAA